MTPTHEACLPRVAAGDGDAVTTVLERYGSLVWTLASRALGDSVLAEDLVQEIFVEVWRSAGRYDPARGSESVFITTIARRRIIDQQRRQVRRPCEESVHEMDFPAEHEAFEGLQHREEAGRALAALGTLVPEQRRVLLLSIREGMSHSQIAAHLGLALGTVKTHIRRGLRRVSELLERGGTVGQEVRP